MLAWEELNESIVVHEAERMFRTFWEDFRNQCVGDIPLMQLVGLVQFERMISEWKEQAVKDAREYDEMTWTEIGGALGVSKQAAAKKYGHLPSV